MLQIRLSRVPSNEVTGGSKPLPAETVTVACPDHLVLADLPVAKGIGGATAASLVKSVGRKSRRQLGERVHFCVRCDFPIAIYGRLSPCEHAFCLDCARSDSICYLCDDRIQKIQTIKIMEGIFICAAPHCLKSFLKRSEFESHIHESHGDLLQPNKEKEDPNESEAQSNRQSTASDSTVRGPPKPFFSLQDREDKAPHPQLGDPARPIIQPIQPPLFSQAQNNQLETSHEKPGPQGILSDTPFTEYPRMHAIQQPNYVIPVNSNPMLTPPLPFGYPPFTVEGAQQPFYSASYEIPRQDSTTPGGSDQAGSLLGFPPNFSGGSYPQPWNSGQVGHPFDHSASAQGIVDGFSNMPGSQAWQQNPSMPPSGANAMDMRDGKGTLAPQQIRGNFYPGEAGRDGQAFGWQHENRDSFGSGHD